MSLPVGSYSGGAGGAAGPSNAGANTGINNSGWNVNFGSGTIDSSGNGWVKWALIAAAGVLAWKLLRRRR